MKRNGIISTILVLAVLGIATGTFFSLAVERSSVTYAIMTIASLAALILNILPNKASKKENTNRQN